MNAEHFEYFELKMNARARNNGFPIHTTHTLILVKKPRSDLPTQARCCSIDTNELLESYHLPLE